MELKPGLVTGKLRLTRLIGEGTMGSVWAAEHSALKAMVAVKFMTDQGMKDPEALARFEREAEVAAKVKSPYIVQTIDRDLTAEGTPYIVMELLEGETLRQRVDRRRLSVRQTAQMIAQVAGALDKAHRVGIVHRDIKPGNIFLTYTPDSVPPPGPEGDASALAPGITCKILDFGIAKHAREPGVKDDLTLPGALMGTPAFMSPEQLLSSKDVDLHADLWSLAVVAYFALTQQKPFAGDTLGELCAKLLRAEFTPPSQVRRGIPVAVDSWFERALARERTKRYQSAPEMAQAFVDIVAQASAGFGFDSIAPGRPSGPGLAALPPEQAPWRSLLGEALAAHGDGAKADSGDRRFPLPSAALAPRGPHPDAAREATADDTLDPAAPSPRRALATPLPPPPPRSAPSARSALPTLDEPAAPVATRSTDQDQATLSGAYIARLSRAARGLSPPIKIAIGAALLAAILLLGLVLSGSSPAPAIETAGTPDAMTDMAARPGANASPPRAASGVTSASAQGSSATQAPTASTSSSTAASATTTTMEQPVDR